MKGYIPAMKYYTLVGLFFYLIALGLMLKSKIRMRKITSEFDLEKKELKAKISDLKRSQQAGSGNTTEPVTPEPKE